MLTIKLTQKETVLWFILLFMLFVSNFVLVGYLVNTIHSESHLAEYNASSLKHAAEYAKWQCVNETFRPEINLDSLGESTQ